MERAPAADTGRMRPLVICAAALLRQLLVSRLP
jgi:hypothetical protein